MRAERLPVLFVLLLAGGIAVASVREAGHRRRKHAEQLARALRPSADDRARGVTRKVLAATNAASATAAAELRRRVDNLAPGTYVGDILAEQDSVLYRWPDRRDDPIRVWIEPASAAADWSTAYPRAARDAFDEWSVAGFPLHFLFIYDSATADITIRWRDRFPDDAGQRIGETERVQTGEALIERARVEVANHDSAGHVLSPTTVGGIVRHEVGHALGLNHANDPSSVMYRESSNGAIGAIGASDRATLHLIYLVPAGSLKH